MCSAWTLDQLPYAILKPDSPLENALEMAWNWKLAHDHVNPPRLSDDKRAVFDLISMLNPADPKNLED